MAVNLRSAEDLDGDTSAFIGRKHEASAVRRLLSDARLLTLTGPGGVGKTRLALRSADRMRRSFRDGVALVELAKLEDADLLGVTVAASVGLQDMGPGWITALTNFLAGKRMLLVLDNCEHVLESCAVLVDALLRHAPKMRVLATSRQSLGVYGEQVLPVPSLSVPDPGEALRSIARHEAVRLFVDRAEHVAPGFELTAENAPVVARLSQRLDGMPLAIELAAVRLRTLPLDQVMRGLDERFEVLVGGSPTALPRHQTLRATMEWSFELCSPAEQRLWSRLSIFAGGADLLAVEAVCAGEGIPPEDVFDLVEGLVDKSILIGERAKTGMRYHMLESIRAYGRERLSSEDEQILRRRFTDYYMGLAEANRLDLLVPDQLENHGVLVREVPNMRVALELCLSDPLTAVIGLRTASALWGYWLLSGSLSEGRYWLERGLDLALEATTVRATALWVYSMLALRQGDVAAAAPRLEECHILARRLRDETTLALAIRTSGVAAFSTGDVEPEEAQRGLQLLEEAVALHRAAGDYDSLVFSLYYAAVYGSVDAPDRSAVLGEECLALSEENHALVTRGYAQFALANALWNLGDAARADALMRELVRFRGMVNDRWGVTQCLELLACTAAGRGEHRRAAWLLGAAHELWKAAGASPTRLRYHADSHKRCQMQARQALGNRAFTSAFGAGTRAGLDQVVDYAAGNGAEH